MTTFPKHSVSDPEEAGMPRDELDSWEISPGKAGSCGNWVSRIPWRSHHGSRGSWKDSDAAKGEFGRNLCRVIGGAAVLGCPSGASGILVFPERFPGSLTSSRPCAPFPVSPEIPKNPIPEFFPERSLPFCVGQGWLGPFPPPQILRDGLFPENWDGIGQGTGSGWDRIAEGWAGNGS